MTLENKLGLTSSAALAREEERISKKRLPSFLKIIFLINWNPENFPRSRRFINIFLTKFTTLPGKSGR